MPLVIVDVGPLEAPPALARELTRACTEVVYDGECTLSNGAAPAPGAVVAVVRWQGAAERRVHIEVGTRADGAMGGSKELAFRPADERVERWRSVGLTVAMMAGALDAARRERAPEAAAGSGSEPVPANFSEHHAAEGTAASSHGGTPGGETESGNTERGTGAEAGEEKPERDPEDELRLGEGSAAAAGGTGGVAGDTGPAGSPGSEARSTAFWVEAGALAGPAIDGGVRSGAWAGAGLHAIRSIPAVFGRVALAHAVGRNARSDVGAAWTSGSLGGGVALEWPEAWLRFEPWLSVTLEILSVNATEDGSGRTDGGGRLEVGARGGASVVLLTGWLRPVVGVEAHWLAAPTEIHAQDRVVARFPATGWDAVAAVRVVP